MLLNRHAHVEAGAADDGLRVDDAQAVDQRQRLLEDRAGVDLAVVLVEEAVLELRPVPQLHGVAEGFVMGRDTHQSQIR